MKLRNERKELAENIIKRKLSDLSPRYKNEMKDVYDLQRRRGQWKSKLNNKHGEHMQEMAEIMLQTYLEAYQAENCLPDDSEIRLTVDRISLQLNNETNTRALEVPGFSGLSSNMVGILNRIKENIELDLRNEKTKVELEKKRQEEINMDEQTLIETERKRYQLLKKIHEKTKGQSSNFISDEQLQKEEGLMREEFFALTDYLKNEGLINYPVLGSITITHRGVKEIEASVRNPDKATEHFTTTVIQNFHAPVYGVQTGNQNVQNIQVNNPPDFNENLSKLIELVKGSSLTEIQIEETIEHLERVGKLAQKEKTPDVLEAAKKRLDLVKTSIDIATNIGPTAITAWQYLYHWFQS